MKKVAPLRYGVIFKKAFCDPEIFSAFVRDVTGVPIEVDRVETEKEFDPPMGRVKSRFDLFAQDLKNRVIVDIQYKRYPDHYDRFLHYHCAALIEQASGSEHYRPPMRVLTVVVLTSGDKHHRDVAVTDFEPKDLKGKGLEETRHKVVYLCPKYANDETPSPYREWLLAIQDTLDGEVEENDYAMPEIRKIFGYIETDSVSPDERAQMFDEHGQALLDQEKIDEGIFKGKRETARNMLQEDLDIALIARVTGLTADEIKAIEG
jgi:predicted transposase/invertase (TIGR01784 family)